MSGSLITSEWLTKIAADGAAYEAEFNLGPALAGRPTGGKCQMLYVLPGSVVHCKKQPFDVYIGRPSKWGNPFAIGKDGTREEVISKYREWLPTQPHLMAALGELKGKILGCWCVPQACHGSVLMEFANGYGVKYAPTDVP